MEIKTINLSAKGQLCIPQKMREEVGFKEGEKLMLIAKDDEIIIKKSKDVLKKLDISKESFETMLMSEAVLAKDWLSKEDEEAWKGL